MITIKGRTVYGPNVVTDGLVLYLDAANTRSYPGTGSTWFDLSRNGNSATLTTNTFSTNSAGTVMFNNNPASISHNSLLNFTNFSVFTWVVPQLTGSYQGIIAKDKNDGTSGWELSYNGGTNVFRSTLRESIGNNNNVTGTTPVTLNKYYFIGISVNSTTLFLYVNGQLEGSTALSSVTINNTLDLKIGGRNINNNNFVGGISNVFIYNKDLTPTEILQNYNATKSRFGLT